jgi:hypothetical protein
VITALAACSGDAKGSEELPRSGLLEHGVELLMTDSSLTVGATYFRLTFADRDLTMPGVQPLVFLGEIDRPESGTALTFQDTVSYVRYGSRFGAKEGFDEMEIYFLSHEEVGSAVLSIEQAAREVSEAAARAVDLGHPVLPVLRSGWQ